MNPTTAVNMTTAISTSTKRNPSPPVSAAFPSEQIKSMETEEHQQTTVTTTIRMNTTHTASNVDIISEQPVVVVVVSDDDEDTDADANTDVPMKATTVLVSSTHLSSSSSSSIVSSSQRRRKEKHRQRREVIRVVRFKKEEEAQDKGVQQKATKWKGKKMSSGTSKHNTTPSASWYTSQEMKDNYKQSISRSSLRMVGGTDENGRTQQQQQCTTSVSWFSYEKRMQRRIRRKQMYKIIQAIQDYEVATHTKVPELLSQLLERHSQPMVEEAIRSALPATASTTDDTVVC